MTPDEEKEGTVLEGHDGAGAPVAVFVPSGGDVTRQEAEIRGAGGRVERARRVGGLKPAGVSAESFARFNESLAAALRRGVNLPSALRETGVHARSVAWARTLEGVRAGVERGEPLGQAFRRAGGDTDSLYGALLDAGEAAGDLGGTLLAVARSARSGAQARRTLAETLVYPVFLSIVCLYIVMAFALYVWPRYNAFAEQMQFNMPGVTRWAYVHQEAARSAVGVVLGLSAVGLAWWFFALPSSAAGLRLREALSRRAPFYGPALEASIWAEAAELLAMMFARGTPAPTAFRLASLATASPWAGDVLRRLSEAAGRGEPLAAAARKDTAAPRALSLRLAEAEAQNDPAGAMTRMAETCRLRMDRRCERFRRWFPVCMALFFGGITLALALELLGPLFSFYWKVQ